MPNIKIYSINISSALRQSVLMLILLSHQVFSQENIPMGTWRTHFNYYDAHSVTFSATRVYCASENGLFYIGGDNSVTRLSTANGLSDSGVGTIRYNAFDGVLVIAYNNGNIDLLGKDGVTNISDILSSAFASKKPYHIEFYRDEAYISAEYGMVVVDMARGEIKEVYSKIGANGTSMEVFSSAITNDSIYIASAEGIKAASMAENVSKIDFQNWRLIAASSSKSTFHIDNIGSKLYYSSQGDSIFLYEGGMVKAIQKVGNGIYASVVETEGRLAICEGAGVYFLDESTNDISQNPSSFVQPRMALVNGDGKLWVADRKRGLISQSVDGNQQGFSPSGPALSSAFRGAENLGRIVVAAGGINTDGAATAYDSTGAFYVFDKGEWKNFLSGSNDIGAVTIPSVKNIVGSAYAERERKTYLAAYQHGILVWDGSEGVDTLESSPLGANPPVSSVASYRDEVWFSLMGQLPSVFYMKDLNGQWGKVEINSTIQPRRLLIDLFGNKWVVPQSGGRVLVFRDEDNFRVLASGEGNGDLPEASVNCMALDREGSIWIGTGEGVVEFFAFQNLYNNGNVDISKPRYDGFPLLKDEVVTAIAVDGGNRKWIATQNGLWLFNARGNQLIHFFSTENSPLLSNTILDIVISPQSGEVFILTDKGLISYRADATEATNAFSDVKVFPNPARPEKDTYLTISGLAENAEVKITDISGKLIYETKAAGGTATWGMRDYSGRIPKTGVYLIFCATSDGNTGHVAKVAIVE